MGISSLSALEIVGGLRGGLTAGLGSLECWNAGCLTALELLDV